MGKKRIEEFAWKELYDTYYNHPSLNADVSWRSVLDYIKNNLDTGNSEPISLESIVAHIRQEIKSYAWGSIESSNAQRNISTQDELVFTLARIVAPLTVQQGFTPDWSKAPELARGIAILWRTHDDGDPDTIQYIPRPAPKMRRKTMSELSREVLDKIAVLDEKALLKACESMSIPLETPE